ncbi:hypothetical protein T05_16046, partial [Trichinella murrelli]
LKLMCDCNNYYKMVRGLLQIPGNAVKIVGQRQSCYKSGSKSASRRERWKTGLKCCLKKCLMSSVCIRLSHAAGRNGNPRKTSDSSTTKSTTQKGNLTVRDRRAATFFHSSVADRCSVCKASACPDVRKQIMVNGGSWRGRH